MCQPGQWSREKHTNYISQFGREESRLKHKCESLLLFTDCHWGGINSFRASVCSFLKWKTDFSPTFFSYPWEINEIIDMKVLWNLKSARHTKNLWIVKWCHCVSVSVFVGCPWRWVKTRALNRVQWMRIIL